MIESLITSLPILLEILLKILMLLIPLLLSVAYLTYAERKVIAAMQLRQGPMLVGPFGLLQPIADGVKLFLKESLIPSFSNQFLFILSPIIAFFLALLLLHFTSGRADFSTTYFSRPDGQKSNFSV